MRKRKNIEVRPWGTYEVLEDRKYYKLKEIVVNPGQRLSYQSRHKRTEVWTVVAGSGVVNLEGQELDAFPGRCFFIPRESKHRMECNGKKPLVLYSEDFVQNKEFILQEMKQVTEQNLDMAAKIKNKLQCLN